jgi:uncharacterized protein YutE (UPF0331/DUF86 family)
MTPLRMQTIDDKLFRLNQYTVFIQDIIRDKSDEQILKDPATYNGLEHMLQLSMQIIFDIGSHILAEGFSVNPKTYDAIIVLLGEKGVITEEFAASQAEMSKFRNKLVHDYDTIEPEKVLQYAHEAPAVFHAFGKAFLEYIDKN